MTSSACLASNLVRFLRLPLVMDKCHWREFQTSWSSPWLVRKTISCLSCQLWHLYKLCTAGLPCDTDRYLLLQQYCYTVTGAHVWVLASNSDPGTLIKDRQRTFESGVRVGQLIRQVSKRHSKSRCWTRRYSRVRHSKVVLVNLIEARLYTLANHKRSDEQTTRPRL